MGQMVHMRALLAEMGGLGAQAPRAQEGDENKVLVNMMLACSRLSWFLRMYVVRILRNSLRHSLGAAHSASFSSRFSAAAVNGPGR